MALLPLLRRRRTWLIGIPLFALLGAVGGPWLYIHVLRDDPPPVLSLDDATTTTGAGDTTTSQTGGGDDIDGTWTVTTGSQAGYRVKEVLFGQDADAVGRTSGVSGTLTIAGTTVTATEVEVDLTAMASDESRRDGQFQGRIMDTATFPTATFSLTEPIALGSVPGDGVDATYDVTGELTLRGVTRAVTFDVTARRTGSTIGAAGSIPIDFDDFAIPDASGGPASVGRDGHLELLLIFTR